MNAWPRSMIVLALVTLSLPGSELLCRADSGFTADPNWNLRSPVQFDLPPLAPATVSSEDPRHVDVELRLSSMMVSTETPRIDQWIVRCQPRDRSLWIADYAPRTETASELATPIQVKDTSEESKGMGVGLDGAYGHLARVHASADQAKKQIRSVQFDRLAPVHAVTASGTINRGRGVYFKLRWTTQQILEGEKTFRITLEVPEQWRGTLIDVSVIAQGERKGFAWEKETTTIGAANFVVAVYRNEDSEAETHARAIAESECALRKLAAKHHARDLELHSLPSVLRHVAHRLDPEYDSVDGDNWLRRLLTGRADPHLDKEIRRLPMPLRVAVLEYAESRERFLAINDAEPSAAIEQIAGNATPGSNQP